MQKFLKTVLSVLLLVVCFSATTQEIKAEINVVTHFDITIDTDKYVLCPTTTGLQVVTKLRQQKYISVGSDDYYIASIDFCYKNNGSYVSLNNSNEFLSDDKDYYVRFVIWPRYSLGEFDIDILPTANVNGAECETAWLACRPQGMVYVYYLMEFDPDGQSVFSVKLNANKKTMKIDTSYQFIAEVIGNPETVNWSIEGNDSSFTNISDDGLLTIGSDETVGKTITVKAVSTFDSEIYDKATVTVTSDLPYISSVKFDKTKGNIRKGDYVEITATVKGTAEDTLIWTLSGNNEEMTTLEVKDNVGTLTISNKEAAGTVIKVVATSQADPTKKATYKATVTKISTISKVNISIDAERGILRNDTVYNDIWMLGAGAITPTITSHSDYYVQIGGVNTYLLAKEGKEWVNVDAFSMDVVDYEKEYLLVMTVKTQSCAQFNTKKLPAVKVDGSKPYKVEWRDKKADGSIKVYIKYNNFKTNFSNKKPTCKVETVDESSLKLTFNHDLDATSYNIYRATSKTGKYSLIEENLVEKTYLDTGLSCGKTYYYKIKANYDDEVHHYISASSKIASGIVLPAAVTGLNQAKSGSKSLKISWKRVDGATGYKVYRASSKKGKYKLVKTVKDSDFTDVSGEYTDTKLKPNTTYYYKVYTYKKVGKKSAVNTSSTIATCLTSPNYPKLTVACKDGCNQVTYSKTAGAYYYFLQRAFNPYFFYVESTRNDTEFTKTYTFKDQGVKVYGKLYRYRIYTESKDGRASDYSPVVEIILIPDAPVVTLKTSSKKVVVSYTKEEVTGGYEIYRSTKKSSGYKLIAENDSETLSFEDATSKGKTYYYKVRSWAYGEDGITKVYSKYSSVKKIKSK